MNDNNLGLYIVATPIGNLGDISKRAVETIQTADFIICENPNHSLKLLNKLGIKKKLISLHDYNENTVIQKLSSQLRERKIVLISDAGSPLVSDPGFKLLKYCIKNNVAVTSIPGPNAIIPALQLSGISLNQFSFLGFFPKTKKDMINFIDKIKVCNETSVFFVSNHKIEECLELINSQMNERQISVVKELTKINEKIYRGLASNIRREISLQNDKVKGEFVIVVEGNIYEKKDSADLSEYNHEIKKMLIKFSLTDVVEIVHKLTGITKNKVYKWVLKLKKT